MSRKTAIAAAVSTVSSVAIALSAVATPAMAEAVVYQNRTVGAHEPGTDAMSTEYATLDIPTGYHRDRMSWHAVNFAEHVENGRSIILDLAPRADTLKKLKAERAAVKDAVGDTYREFDFTVNDKDSKVRARWVFTYTEDGTGDTEPYISIYLMRGNRLQVTGKLSERKHVNFIRQHVVKSVKFPG